VPTRTDGAIHQKASVAGPQPVDHFPHHHRPVDEIQGHALVPQLWPAPNNDVTRFQILARFTGSAVGVACAAGISARTAFFGGSGFATSSKSVSLRSFRRTFTLSSDNSP